MGKKLTVNSYGDWSGKRNAIISSNITSTFTKTGVSMPGHHNIIDGVRIRQLERARIIAPR